MPTYVYLCPKCNKTFEILMAKHHSKAQCWRCSTVSPQVITPPAGIHFKGGGWAKNGYSKPEKEADK